MILDVIAVALLAASAVLNVRLCFVFARSRDESSLDTHRLDWLEANPIYLPYCGNNQKYGLRFYAWSPKKGSMISTSKIREAIDQAMKIDSEFTEKEKENASVS